MTTDNDKCPCCGKTYHIQCGRSLSITDEQIASILAHSRAEQPKLTITSYCKQLGISRYTYRLVVRMRLKKSKDIERVLRVQATLNNAKEVTQNA